MKKLTIMLCFCAMLLHLTAQKTDRVKTTFQTSQEWRPTIDVRADAVMVYGVNGNPTDTIASIPFQERVKSWKDKGYIVHFMTGIAWGDYQDYFTGKWDGKWHLDEGQVTQKRDTLWHGYLTPYVVPTENFLTYIKEEHVKKVIDAGVDAIFMEEPEFWAEAGYSDSFKKEWEKYYNYPWRAQHLSPENTWLSNKLKYELYFRALKEVFTYAKEYGKSKGMDVKCYVPTHSLVNYSQWQIVSPEASLASLDCVDGYIAQVWTGTSRTPNYYNGIYKERVFENAFLEYASMESMTAPTGRKIFFLTDPIEDRPRDWDDFRRNYEATFTAQLLFPNMANYEVMPWPERIYEGLYNVSTDSEEKARIPRSYSTQMQVMINALNEIPVSDNKVTGSSGISVLMGNSLMFQKFPIHNGYDDPQLSNFYGLAFPLLKKGVPVGITHIENLEYPETLKDVDILLMTYSNMKPLDTKAHSYLYDWVQKGGTLVYCGRDEDPFQKVSEWWNSNGLNYPTASAQLFELFHLGFAPSEGTYKIGDGILQIIRQDPKELVLEASQDTDFVNKINELYEKSNVKESLSFKNNFHLTRGNYELISVMEESVSDEPFVIDGLFIDLFNPNIPILTQKIVEPGMQAMLLNIDSVKNKDKPQVLASASRVTYEKIVGNKYSFITKGPIETTNVMRILLPQKPKDIKVADRRSKYEWDSNSKTLFLTFDNDPNGVSVVVNY